MSTDFQTYLQGGQQRAATALELTLPAISEPASRLKQAMRYSALNGGKRVRAALVYAAYEAVAGTAPAATDALACAAELIHA